MLLLPNVLYDSTTLLRYVVLVNSVFMIRACIAIRSSCMSAEEEEDDCGSLKTLKYSYSWVLGLGLGLVMLKSC